MTPKKVVKKRLTKRNAPKSKRKTAQSKAVARRETVGKKAVARKKLATPRKQVRGKAQRDTVPFSLEEPVSRPGGQSGDVQGLSNAEGADSESVQELLEEGNAFEADVVTGVEKAAEVREVRTREVPEDDVPGEYLDNDK